MTIELSSSSPVLPDVAIDRLVAYRQPPLSPQPPRDLFWAPLLLQADQNKRPILCLKAPIAPRSTASPPGVVIGQVRSIGPAPSILRVAAHLTADRTSMSAQCSSDRSLVASLFSERRERISLTRGELAIPVHELPPFRREGRSAVSQLASTSFRSPVGRFVALSL